MSDPIRDSNPGYSSEVLSERLGGRMSVEQIARRLDIGRLAVYSMLEQGILPGIRLGRRWIITRHAYEQWERTCGMRVGAGLPTQPEVMVLN
jgi:excisionase family DNA binding protein